MCNDDFHPIPIPMRNRKAVRTANKQAGHALIICIHKNLRERELFNQFSSSMSRGGGGKQDERAKDHENRKSIRSKRLSWRNVSEILVVIPL